MVRGSMKTLGTSAAGNPKRNPVRKLNSCLPEALAVDADVEISGMSLDSRSISQGDLFVALKGLQHDGHEFVAAAIARGAAAVLAEKTCEISVLDEPVSVVVDKDLRRDLGAIAARYFGEPGRSMWGCGITGTNGKTSVAWYLTTILNALGSKTGFLGTTGWGIPPDLESSNLTTVDPITLQRRLADLASRASHCFVMEVSSHALQQHRINGAGLDCAVFTNLSRDHLDYHGSFASYAQAKKSLFQQPDLSAVVINADDDVGMEIYRSLPSGVEVLRYGKSPSADVRWSDVRYLDAGIAAQLHSPWGTHELVLPLYGEFNLANAVAAICAAITRGCGLDEVLATLSLLQAAPGRMEFFTHQGCATAVVDYAHTPDALVKALEALRYHASGRLICVFGCGGNRDLGKRPLMAQAVQSAADEAWLTTDNPRFEDPEDIAQGALEGFSCGFPVTLELDRSRAIERALSAASAGDIVLIAGKGHESYQEILGEKHAFSDREFVLRLQEAG